MEFQFRKKSVPLVLLLSFFFCTFSLNAQLKYHFGAEIGCYIPKFPVSKIIESNDGFTISKKSTPVPKPLFGLVFKMSIKDKYYVNTSFQYQMTNIKYDSEYDNRRFQKIPYFIDHYHEDHKYHKLNLQLNFGYNFLIKSNSYSFFLGFRPNYFFNANFYLSNEFKSTYYTKNSFIQVYTGNICRYEIPRIKRWHFQVGGGITSLISEKIFLSLTSNFGIGQLYYREENPFALTFILSITDHINNDFGISFVYLLNAQKKLSSNSDL